MEKDLLELKRKREASFKKRSSSFKRPKFSKAKVAKKILHFAFSVLEVLLDILFD